MSLYYPHPLTGDFPRAFHRKTFPSGHPPPPINTIYNKCIYYNKCNKCLAAEGL